MHTDVVKFSSKCGMILFLVAQKICRCGYNFNLIKNDKNSRLVRRSKQLRGVRNPEYFDARDYDKKRKKKKIKVIQIDLGNNSLNTEFLIYTCRAAKSCEKNEPNSEPYERSSLKAFICSKIILCV